MAHNHIFYVCGRKQMNVCVVASALGHDGNSSRPWRFLLSAIIASTASAIMAPVVFFNDIFAALLNSILNKKKK